MKIRSIEGVHNIMIEDKEDLIHCRPILHHSDIQIKRKIYKKEEFKVKRKQEIIWEQLYLTQVSSRINKENLLLQGMSNKGQRVISISPGDQFTLHKFLNPLEQSVLNALTKKRTLQM